MTKKLASLVVIFALAALSSCSSPPAASTVTTSSTPGDTAIHIPATGVKTVGDLRVWIVTTPSPPKSGNDTLEAFIVDASGQPVTDTVLTFDLNMTNMNMGQSIYHPSMMSLGRYSSTVRFSMPGPWRVNITIVRGGKTSSVYFDFSVR